MISYVSWDRLHKQSLEKLLRLRSRMKMCIGEDGEDDKNRARCCNDSCQWSSHSLRARDWAKENLISAIENHQQQPREAFNSASNSFFPRLLRCVYVIKTQNVPEGAAPCSNRKYRLMKLDGNRRESGDCENGELMVGKEFFFFLPFSTSKHRVSLHVKCLSLAYRLPPAQQ